MSFAATIVPLEFLIHCWERSTRGNQLIWGRRDVASLIQCVLSSMLWPQSKLRVRFITCILKLIEIEIPGHNLLRHILQKYCSKEV